MVNSPQDLSPYQNNTLLLVIAPPRKSSDEELVAYHAFIERGNTLFLADDFSKGDAILRGLGSRITILEGNLSSIDRQYSDPQSVVVYGTRNDSIVQSSVSLVLNRPAPLEGGTPLLRSSIMSWIDENRDMRLNDDEMMGQYPVMTEEVIGKGRLVVFSDPSIFINLMQEPDQPGDNRRFVLNLVNNNGMVLVDQMNSRTCDAEGFSEILHLVRTTITIKLMFLALLILAVLWIWRRKMV